MVMNIMKTHQLGIDECYHSSMPNSLKHSLHHKGKLGSFLQGLGSCRIFEFFPLDYWVMLFHILPLIILSTVREVRDTIALYHSKDNKTSLADAQSLLGIHNFANHAKFPPTSPPKKSMIRLLGTGKGMKGKRCLLVPFINILLEFVKNIYNHFSFFQTLQTNKCNELK